MEIRFIEQSSNKSFGSTGQVLQSSPTPDLISEEEEEEEEEEMTNWYLIEEYCNKCG